MEDDGSTRQIRRFYINKGLLKQVDEKRNNEALLIRTLTYLNDTPAAGLISGYTLISTNVENPNGLETTTYTYAKGTGQISQDDEFKNNDKLLIRTIRYLSVPSVTVNPITTPTGYIKVKESVDDQEGHRVWTATYAKGNGLIDTNAETRLGGLLLRTTLTYLTDPSVTSNPTTDPFGSGGFVVRSETQDSDGHRVWTVVWTKAVTASSPNNGNTTSTVEYKNIDQYGNPSLTIYRKQRLGAPPLSPGANAVLISSTTTSEDGYILYDQTWALGTGVITTSLEHHNQDLLKIYTAVSLNAIPTAPTGVWALIDESSRIENGMTVYTRKWAQGAGVIEMRTSPREGGLRIETWVSLGQAYDPGYMKPIGVLAAKDSDYIDGVTRWTVSCFQLSNGTDPTAGIALSYTTKRVFTYPGRAKAFSVSTYLLGANKINYDVFKSPPVQALVDATVTVTYQTSSTIGALSFPLWNPTTWATIRSWFLGWQGAPNSITESIPNYRAQDGYNIVTFNGGATGYDQSAFGTRVYGINTGSPYFIEVSGGPVAPDGNTYTIETPTLEPAFIGYDDGTQYYRRTVVNALIPAQPALPV
jgi:hypothetical protein